MGLDMYLKGQTYIPYDKRKKDNRTGLEKEGEIFRLGYWRKHPNLHGYIVNEFAGGKDECQEIELDREALLNIMNAVKTGKLPETTGFFFGQSLGTEEERAEDIAILERAMAWLDDDEGVYKTVIYQASW